MSTKTCLAAYCFKHSDSLLYGHISGFISRLERSEHDIHDFSDCLRDSFCLGDNEMQQFHLVEESGGERLETEGRLREAVLQREISYIPFNEIFVRVSEKNTMSHR